MTCSLSRFRDVASMNLPATSGGAFTEQHGLPPAAAAPTAKPVAPAAADLTTPWPHRVQWATASLLALAVILLIVHAVVVQPAGSRPTSLQRGDGPRYRV